LHIVSFLGVACERSYPRTNFELFLKNSLEILKIAFLKIATKLSTKISTIICTWKLSGTMQRILDIGNLKVKTIVRTGEKDNKSSSLIGANVLVYGWDQSSDKMKVKFPIIIINKKREYHNGSTINTGGARNTSQCLPLAMHFGTF